MSTRALLTSLLSLCACASISGSQTFEALQEYSLPNAGNTYATDVTTTVTVSANSQRSFAAAVLDDIAELRAQDHVDSAEASVQIASIQLATDTTFAGVKAVRVQLVTPTETVELCNRVLSASDEQSSSVSCRTDYRLGEDALQQSATSEQPTRIDLELQVSGAVTATTLTSTVAFEVEVDVDASL